MSLPCTSLYLLRTPDDVKRILEAKSLVFVKKVQLSSYADGMFYHIPIQFHTWRLEGWSWHSKLLSFEMK